MAAGLLVAAALGAVLWSTHSQSSPITATSIPVVSSTPTSSTDNGLVDAVTGGRWVLTDAGDCEIPSPVPYLAPLPAGDDGLLGAFDGCNSGTLFGTIDPASGQLQITRRQFTEMACPGVAEIALPAIGVLTLSDDRRTLVVDDATVEQGPLTFRRSDALGDRVRSEQLVGMWESREGGFGLALDADGRMSVGACTMTWALDDAVLRIDGIPETYGDSCLPRLLGPLATGPFEARLSTEGALWLVADRTVLRLSHADPPPAPPPSAPITMIDVAPVLEPIEGLEPCEPGRCPSVAVAPDGTVVGYDPVSHTILVGRRGETPSTAVVISGVPPTVGYIVGIGPDDVAYLAVQAEGVADPVGHLIAVPISGSKAGIVIARADGVVDLSGDSSLVATANGLVPVGCCGSSPVLPEPDRQPLLGWVDQSQASVGFGRGVFSMERTDDLVIFVRTEADGTQSRWSTAVDDAGAMRDIPGAAMGDDGSVLVVWSDWAAGGQRLLRLLADGRIEEIVVPATISVVALSPMGAAIVYDGSSFLMWRLPAG